MKLKASIALALSAMIAASLVGAPGVASAAKKKKAPKGPVVLGTDPAGDWAYEGDDSVNPIGDAMGQDLTEAAIELVDGDTLNFIITVNSLPAIGGIPEVTRYGWDMLVDGENVQLDGKFTNYSRGACDPTSGQCPPPRDPGSAPFMVRGNCEVTGNLNLCEELGIVEAAFDPAEGTITIPVPLEMINAKKGTKITPAVSAVFGGTIEVAPSAFFTYGAFPHDAMILTKTYKVPKK
ncbi:MAG: hypothetical protein ACR2KQ_06580 [Actinomycetota bacterium]